MTDLPEIPHRRHQLTLKLEADDIGELENALTQIGTHLLMDDMRGRDWSQPVDIASGGYHSGHSLTLTSDLTIDGDAYRASLKTWSEANRAARNASDERGLATYNPLSLDAFSDPTPDFT